MVGKQLDSTTDPRVYHRLYIFQAVHQNCFRTCKVLSSLSGLLKNEEFKLTERKQKKEEKRKIAFPNLYDGTQQQVLLFAAFDQLDFG